MKKSNLKNGMILERENGVRGIYHNGIMVDLNGKWLSSLNVYDENLVVKENSLLGITKIFNSNLELIYTNESLIQYRENYMINEYKNNPFVVKGFTK